MISSAKKIICIVKGVESREILVQDGFEQIVTIIAYELESIGKVKNMHNCAQIVEIMAADFFPKNVLSNLTVNKIERGGFPLFNDEPVESYGIYRACAVFILSIISSKDVNMPKKGAKMLLVFFENSEHAPDDIIE